MIEISTYNKQKFSDDEKQQIFVVGKAGEGFGCKPFSERFKDPDYVEKIAKRYKEIQKEYGKE